MAEIDLLDVLPQAVRPIDERAAASAEDRRLSWKLDREYFDGTRAQGYGGYRLDGRWKPVARRLIEHYRLGRHSRVLDIGCAKGFLLHAFLEECPGIEIAGLDISAYALGQAPEPVKPHLCLGNAKQLPFPSDSFDLVFCKDSLHNILSVDEVVEALGEIERVGRGGKFIRVGAYRNPEEKAILDKWAVVATTYLPPEDWLRLFARAGYTGDYWWFNP